MLIGQFSALAESVGSVVISQRADQSHRYFCMRPRSEQQLHAWLQHGLKRIGAILDAGVPQKILVAESQRVDTFATAGDLIHPKQPFAGFNQNGNFDLSGRNITFVLQFSDAPLNFHDIGSALHLGKDNPRHPRPDCGVQVGLQPPFVMVDPYQYITAALAHQLDLTFDQFTGRRFFRLRHAILQIQNHRIGVPLPGLLHKFWRIGRHDQARPPDYIFYITNCHNRIPPNPPSPSHLHTPEQNR